MILAGDVGGTKTRLALFDAERGSGRLRGHAERTYPSREHKSLEEIVSRFRLEVPAQVERAAFGVAGPVRDGVCITTNLPWVVEAASLAALLKIPRSGLLNDLEANAWGLGELEERDTVVLQAGAAGAAGNSAIIAAGTGLGEAGLFFDGRRHVPFATEGGHADFAPRSTIEDELLGHLRARYDRVSWERVVSGPGLVEIHDFLAGRAGTVVAHSGEDRGPEITRAGLEGTSRVASEALDLFVSCYGAEAGNLALKMMATAGLFIGGGIAPRIIERIRSGGFMQAFLDKGRMRPLLEAMPVRVVLNDRTALLGAARHAMEST